MSIITPEEYSYLLKSIKSLLEKYDYSFSTSALETIIDEWAKQKSTLIEAFKKHPNYVDGQFMIAYTKDYEREINNEQAERFSKWLLSTAVPACKDHMPTEVININNYWEYQRPLTEKAYDAIWDIRSHAERTICDRYAITLNNLNPNLRVREGEKTTRAVNRLCKYLGLDKHPDYNKEYAKYADSLSPMTIKRHTILSINPLDYLTMSFGNSWSSCHTIDKENYRDMPHGYEGAYSSGTISYMLDKPSMVLYTVDNTYEVTEYWTQPKINRQMFHYGEEKLIQARLYPQDNDDNNDAYTPFRQLVQEIISTAFDFPNLWKVRRGVSPIREYVYGEGTHYKDYFNFDSCTISRHEEENNSRFIIGAEPICIECGCHHEVSDNINCCSSGEYCEHCGCHIDRGDVVWIGDDPYCDDCVFYCSCCDEYYLQDDVRYVNGHGYVCDGCIDDYFTYCDSCDEYHHNDEMTYVDSDGYDVCDDCLDKYYTRCDKCGEYYHNDYINVTEDDKNLCDGCYDEYCAETESEEE